MDPSSVPDDVWTKLVSTDIEIKLEFLATKILLTRLRRDVRINPSPACSERCARELRSLFAKYWYLPKVRNDLKKIMDQGVM